VITLGILGERKQLLHRAFEHDDQGGHQAANSSVSLRSNRRTVSLFDSAILRPAESASAFQL
jgi:hypothetical protein